MSEQSISVIIVTFNSSSDIEQCLSSLFLEESGLLSEIIVVDNASADQTCSLIERHERVKLVRHASNKGFAAAVNTGVANASGDYLLVLNPDVRITPTSISCLVKDMEEDSKLAALGCELRYEDGHCQPSARRFPTIASFIGRVLLTNSIARHLRIAVEPGEWKQLSSNRGITQVDWVLGGCILIRRSAYGAIGPLDERYFLYYEDIDWCYRASLADWKIGFSSNAYAIHEHKRSSSRVNMMNRLMWVHLASASHFFLKYAAQRGLRTVA